MTNIYLKRNELSEKSKQLRSIKFDINVKNEKSFELDREQDTVYNKFKFYNEYIKAKNKKEVKEK